MARGRSNAAAIYLRNRHGRFARSERYGSGTFSITLHGAAREIACDADFFLPLPGRSHRSTELNMHCKRLAAAGLLAAFGCGTAAYAQTVAEFYKGRDVFIEIGYSPGGAYDVYARTVARFLGNHIPGGPTVVPKNVIGDGSLRLADWLYDVAIRDGTEIGTIGRGIAFDPLLGTPEAAFDPLKFTWLGSANNEVSVCVSWHTSGITRFEDLYSKPMTVGGTGGGSDTDVFPQVLNGVLGTKMKVISGYPGGNDVNLAMERGEVQGRCGWSWSSVVATHPEWVAQHKINILAQLSLSKHPDLPNVPLILDLAKTAEQKQIFKLIFARQVMGRPYLAPPGLPAERARALQQAFRDTMKDPKFLAEAGKQKLEINPVFGPEIEQLLKDTYAMPKTVVAAAARLINASN
jgi:tripartite-type tricarboxylate transporter receptor subunit TctC